MTIQVVRDTLLWGAVINYVVLIVWFLTVALHWEWPYAASAKWFGISREKVNAINFAAFCLYKGGIVLFFLAPYIALLIATKGQ